MPDVQNPVILTKDEEVVQNKDEIAQLLADAGAVPQDPDTTRVILEDLHNPEHIPSLTNVTRVEIDAVRLATGMNMFAKSPLIRNDIQFYLDLKRSQTNNPTSLLNGLFQIATRTIGYPRQ